MKWQPKLYHCAMGADNIFIKYSIIELLQLLGRMGTIEEAGQLCLYLAAEGTFITGVDIPLSGGAELNYGRKTRLEEKSNVYD